MSTFGEGSWILMSTLRASCQPLEKYGSPRDVDEIVGKFVIIYMVEIDCELVDVNICDGYF
jgi:hypothetical protein